MSGSRLAGWRRGSGADGASLFHVVVSSSVGLQVSRAASCSGLKVPKCNKREGAPVGLHFPSLWVMFGVDLLANPKSLWGGTTQGYECREGGTNRGYYCTIYQAVTFVHIYYLVSVLTF